MLASVVTVAFEGVDARRVDVQVHQLPSGDQSSFTIVGLADKAVAESRERVRGAFAGIGLSLPAKRIIVNMAPADLPKEGSHFDLPIALALLASMGVIPPDMLSGWAAVGELGLDGRIAPVGGTLPAAVAVDAMGLGLICPEANGPEAAWAGEVAVLAPRSLIGLVNHFKGTQVLRRPEPGAMRSGDRVPDLREVKGQESAKRALEIAAAGGHNLLFVGPPGSGKSMMAARLPGLLPPLTPKELLETSMVWSVAGLIERGALTRDRPFRSPHHSASMAALTGGGLRAKPGEASLAHNGVLFLDELGEFAPSVLDALRQPLEEGVVRVARAKSSVQLPAKFLLVAATNPCPCGEGTPGLCVCDERAKQKYLRRFSGPLLDRFDLRVAVTRPHVDELLAAKPAESSKDIALRVATARELAISRNGCLNSALSADALERCAPLSPAAASLLRHHVERGRLSGRGYHRIRRVARTVSDLRDQSEFVEEVHVAVALALRVGVQPQFSGDKVVQS
jgi:magnesium chelatase family protein